MKVFAPGKLVLTGAYAVLERAPALVLATTRGALADTARVALEATQEVRAALGELPSPHVDASSLFVGDRKLGLGASSAVLVAALAAREADRGADLADPRVRDAIFVRARKAHAEAQGGGSGVDVAASVYGGTLRYVMGEAPVSVKLPARTRIAVFACGTSARTSALRGNVDRLAQTNPSTHRLRLDELAAIARAAATAVEEDDHDAFVASIAAAARSLSALGEAAGAPIVPGGFDTLEAAAAAEGAAFCVSGAGGGDVAIHVGTAPPTKAFLERAHALGLFLLDVDFDEKGVRVVPTAPAIVAERLGPTPGRT